MAVVDASRAASGATPPIAGRYVVEERLAGGGMGEVFRVFDPTSSRRVALKRLLPGTASPNFARMLEREYHTLAGLAHPRIIEVYDYGVADGLPFYTMELLDGKDLREVAPLPAATACQHLYDVASSLALLHARRLLHRDLSPRNVRVTSSGHCKLIDFGALASFGVSEVIVGTPPLVAPEMLHGAALDQRADLFALGALAYWLLTGRHAYPAREFSELPEQWRVTPRRPARLAAKHGLPEIPAPLEELVMALLTLDPLGRPSTAAEVMDRLADIGKLASGREALSYRSYLRSPAFIGRDDAMQLLERHVELSQGKSAGAVLIEAAPGLGATRVLSELALRVQLAGSRPIVVDAALHREPYGVVHAVIDKLLRVSADDALGAVQPHAAVLAGFSSRLAARLELQPERNEGAGVPSEQRRRVQNALVEWFAALSERRPLVLLIDNLDHADEVSVALFGSLARLSSSRPLALVMAHRALEPNARKLLAAVCSCLTLPALDLEHVRALVRSLFGAVEHTARLSEHVYGLSGGNPRACMELVEHFLDVGALRYADGVWVLPQELPDEVLPASIEQISLARISRLSEPAQRLAEVFAVHNGGLSVARCVDIAKAQQIQAAFTVIDELVCAGILRQGGAGYQLSHESLRALLLARLPAARAKALHVQLGVLLSAQSSGDITTMLDAGWHLLHGGEETRGAELLASAGLHAYTDDAMLAGVAPLRAALAIFRKQARGPHELIKLLGPLTIAGYYCDWRLADEFGAETTALMQQVIGLRTAARLRPLLGARASFYIGLANAALRFMWPGRGGLGAMRSAVQAYLTCITILCSVAVICFRADDARRYARMLEPFQSFGPKHGAYWAYRFTSVLPYILEERMAETCELIEPILARLQDPAPLRDLPLQARRLLEGACLMALGAIEVFCVGSKALAHAQRLEDTGMRVFAMVSAQIRANYYALHGDLERARRYRERVETHAVQAGSNWQAEIWIPFSRVAEQVQYGDRVGLRHSAETLETLAVEIPSLARSATLARAAYFTTRGDHAAAVALRQPVLDAHEARGYVGWFSNIATQAQGLRELGELDASLKLLQNAISLLTPQDRRVVLPTHFLYINLAFGMLARNDPAAAIEIIDGMLQEYADCENALVLGNLHMARARIALSCQDHPTADEHLTQAERHYRPTDNPHLIARAAQLRRELDQLSRAALASSVPPADEQAEQMLRDCSDPAQRARRALDLLLARTGSPSAVLFGFEAKQLRLLTCSAANEPSETLTQHVAELIAAHQQADAATVVEGAKGRRRPDPVRHEGYRVIVLCSGQDQERIVGAVAIADSHALRMPAANVIRAIADAIVA